MSLAETKAALAKAQLDYNAVAETAAPPVIRKASDVVGTLKKQLIAEITAGAVACPGCGNPPHGLEQPRGTGGVEYEIGCVSCKAFVHTDGTVRLFRVRGGLIPRHAVEGWNAGPDFWQEAKPVHAAAVREASQSIDEATAAR